MPVVHARIELPADAPVERARTVRVTVEDVTLADAASTTVAERVLEDVPLGAVRALEVDVDVPEVDPSRRFICRVHADVDGTGTVSSGDLLSTAAHPVLTDGHGTATTVVVRRI